MASLLVLGAGGHANSLFDSIQASGFYDTLSILDDTRTSTSLGLKVDGPLETAFQHSSLSKFKNAFVAIGDPVLRLHLMSKLIEYGYNLPTIKHPLAYVSASATVASGCLLTPYSVVNSLSCVGMGSILNTSSVVEHDCVIGQGVHVCPGSSIAGNVSVGDRSWIGIGASIVHGLSICSDVTIGAGGVVISDLVVPGTYVGVPVRLISTATSK